MNLPFTLLDLSSYLGQGAAGAITINLLLGMLMSLRYSPVQRWPRRRINLFALHQWTAYLAIVLIFAHPLVLLWLDKPRFRIVDLLWPIDSPLQPWINLVGAICAYLILIVLVSSLLRTQIGRPIWRRLHYLVFPAAVLLFVHGILTDPELKDGHPDLLDGGKIFLEAAALLFLAAATMRYRLRGKGLRSVDRDTS